MPGAAGLRAVAAVEALKGALVLLVGFGALDLIHHNVQAAAERFIVEHHLNPAGRYPRILFHAAEGVTRTRLILFAAGTVLYAAVRFTEAYGLWRNRNWGPWFAALSGGLYLPFELWELVRHATWIKALFFIINIGIVLYMVNTIRRRRAYERREGERSPGGGPDSGTQGEA